MSEARARGSSRDAASTAASPNTVGRGGGTGRPETTSRDASRVAAGKAAPVRTAVDVAIAPVGFICPPCGRFVRTDLDGVLWRARTGSSPRFCSPGCRQAAYRRRRAGVNEGVALQLGGGRNRSLAQMTEADDD
jgi:hypothetical protein